MYTDGMHMYMYMHVVLRVGTLLIGRQVDVDWRIWQFSVTSDQCPSLPLTHSHAHLYSVGPWHLDNKSWAEREIPRPSEELRWGAWPWFSVFLGQSDYLATEITAKIAGPDVNRSISCGGCEHEGCEGVGGRTGGSCDCVRLWAVKVGS